MPNKVNNMVGILGVDPSKPTRDNDGDNVVNVLDCEPNNKKKQGFIHDFVEKRRLRKAGVSEDKIEAVQSRRREDREIERTKTRRLRDEVRTSEKRRFNVERERLRTDTRLQRIKDREKRGGVINQFVGGFSPPQKAKRQVATGVRPKKRSRVVYEKVGDTFVKRGVKRRSKRPTTKRVAPRKPQSLDNFIGGRFKGGF